MAPHSSTPAWKIPWTEEPVRLQPMGSRRVLPDCATSLSLFTFMHWRRKWQPTPVFLPGESQGWGGLVGCHLWGRAESDMTEATQQQHSEVICIHKEREKELPVGESFYIFLRKMDSLCTQKRKKREKIWVLSLCIWGYKL